jgi:hypothetical protein
VRPWQRRRQGARHERRSGPLRRRAQALAAAVRVDEAKDVRDRAVAMAHYAKQAKDGDLIGFATEIRKRAERRFGEIIEENRKAGKLAKPTGGKRPKGNGFSKNPMSLSRSQNKAST